MPPISIDNLLNVFFSAKRGLFAQDRLKNFAINEIIRRVFEKKANFQAKHIRSKFVTFRRAPGLLQP